MDLDPSLLLHVGVPGPPFSNLACSVGDCHSNQQSFEAELLFWNLKVVGLLTSNL